MANAVSSYLLYSLVMCYIYIYMRHFFADRNLIIYPNGNKTKNVKEHLSFYLAMAETNSLPTGWEVCAVFKLFVLDQNKDNYMIVQGNLSSNLYFIHRIITMTNVLVFPSEISCIK